MDEGLPPNFTTLHDTSRVYLTDAKAKGDALNPWIQWFSIHTGLTADKHKVRRLNEAKNFKGAFLWDTLSDSGYSCWICGSMNANYRENFRGELLPDPWSTDVTSYPQGHFDDYFLFVKEAVTGTSTGRGGSYWHFLRYMLMNGISLFTLANLIKQVCHEKFAPKVKWKRAMLLDQIQFDLF